MKKRASQLKSLLSSDGSRGLSPLSSGRDYLEAARQLCCGLRVAVVTGFFIPDAGAPETDGPLGSAALARAVIGRGGSAVLVTDQLCERVVRAAARVLGILVIVAADSTVFDQWKADLLVFCERPGAGADGQARSMHGLVVPHAQGFEQALSPWTQTPRPSIALGDGGNEAGMGIWREVMAVRRPEFSPNLAVSQADWALTADVSDWGAWGLAGLCSTPERYLGLFPHELEAGLQAMVAAGAVDGTAGKPCMSIDGFSLDECQKKLEAINRCCGLQSVS